MSYELVIVEPADFDVDYVDPENVDRKCMDQDAGPKQPPREWSGMLTGGRSVSLVVPISITARRRQDSVVAAEI